MVAEHNKKALLPVYLMIGTNTLKIKTAIAHLKSYLAPGFEISNYEERSVDAHLDVSDITSALDTLPFGEAPRIIVLHMGTNVQKNISEVLLKYVLKPNVSSVLCLLFDKLARTTKIYKAVEKFGTKAIIDCTEPKGRALEALVSKMAHSYGMHLDQDACSELLTRSADSLLLLDQSVKSLALICSKTGHIGIEDVKKYIAQTQEVSPWRFLDALSARDAKTALLLLKEMHKPSFINLTALIATRIRELICAKALSLRAGYQNLASELHKADWQVKNYRTWAENFDMRELEHLLAACARCERALKNTSSDEQVFLELILAIVAKA